jgi:similar to stage IV sporulation protein
MELVKIAISYILGYVRITVEGYYIERFINICINNKILIWNIKREKGGVKILLNVGINDFKKLGQIAKKTKCKIKIYRKRGMPFLLNRYRKRKIFGLFLIIVIMLIMISSNYIWNVDIQIEDNEQLEGIAQELEEAGLTVGKNKNKIKTSEIIQYVRLKRKDISWIGIELKGTNAIVKLVKAQEAPEIIDENDYTNIVANRSGIITKIVAQNGTAKVKVGDTVETGTVLIEGTMEGKYTDLRYVHSIGEVEAKVWYSKTKKIYYTNEEKEYTKNEENKYSIKINNFRINFYKTLSNFEIYDTIEKEEKAKIFSNLYLPISLVKTTNREQKNVEIQHSLEEAEKIGIAQAKQELEAEIKDLNSILRRGNKFKRIQRWNRSNCYI